MTLLGVRHVRSASVVAVSTWAAITGARPLQCYVLFCDVLFVCLSGTSSVMG